MSDTPWTDAKINCRVADSAQWLAYINGYYIRLYSARNLIREINNAWQANHDALTAKLNAANARITELERNGHIPLRDTVGGVITSEWATPEEDAAWAHLESEGDDD